MALLIFLSSHLLSLLFFLSSVSLLSFLFFLSPLSLKIGMRCDSAIASIYNVEGKEIENAELYFAEEGTARITKDQTMHFILLVLQVSSSSKSTPMATHMTPPWCGLNSSLCYLEKKLLLIPALSQLSSSPRDTQTSAPGKRCGEYRQQS